MDALRIGTGSSDERLVPAPAVAIELGVTRRTLGRWFVDPRLEFPKPAEINRRLYFRRAEIEEWKISRLRKSSAEL
jgi:predicted DNA-binding transcriptional regulator AlpA